MLHIYFLSVLHCVMLEATPFDDQVTCIKTASPLGEQAIMWVYAYLVEDVLFDAGCANALSELQELTKKRSVRRVYVTHYHEDHYGGCAAFVPNADVFVGSITLESVHKPYSLSQFFQWVWGEPKPVKEAQKFEESNISVGKLNFEVVDLSGHCEEMFGFWEPEKGWFFSADAVPLPSRKQMAMPEENIPRMINRMKEIRDLDVKVLFDGHRGPIPNPRDHIETRINYLSQLQRRVLSMAETGKTIPEIKTELGFPEPWYLPNTEGRFEIEHLIRSLLEDSV
ncbi:MAG: MBL fold metallo-hydrolase [Promethearchaeota archaeon]